MRKRHDGMPDFGTCIAELRKSLDEDIDVEAHRSHAAHVLQVKPFLQRPLVEQRRLMDVLKQFHSFRRIAGEAPPDEDWRKLPAPDPRFIIRYMELLQDSSRRWQDLHKAAVKCYLVEINRPDLVSLVVIPRRGS